MTHFDPRLTPARPDLAAAQLRGQIAAEDYVEGHAMHVCVGTADLRHAPAPDAPLDTQALFGEDVMLYEDHEGWGWVQLARDGYVGYMSMAALAEGRRKPTHRVTVNRSFVYPGPDLKFSVRDALPLGAVVRVRATKGGFAQIDDAAFVFSGHLLPSGERSQDFVAVAERLLHAPYLWGGKTSLGIDCSGLVQISLAAAGFDAPRDTDLQEQALGLPIAIDTDLAALAARRPRLLARARRHHARRNHAAARQRPSYAGRKRAFAHRARQNPGQDLAANQLDQAARTALNIGGEISAASADIRAANRR